MSPLCAVKALKVGDRVFSVSLEGKLVVKDLDVTKEATGPMRRVIREFPNIEIDGPLDIQLTATAGTSLLTGVELIAR